MAFKKATLQNAASATGNGGAIETEGMSIVGLQVTGTFVATVSFEATINDVDWFALQGMNPADGSLASTTTATGAWVCSVAGLSRVRARIGPYTNGTVTVMALASENGSLSLNDISVTSAAAVTQGTSPWVVSGAVTANAGTNLNTSALATESALIDFISAFQAAMAGGVTVNSGFNIDTSALALEAGNLAAIKAAIEILDNVVSGNEAQVDVLTLPSIAQLPAALGAGGGLKVDGSGTALPVSGTATVTQGAAGAQAWPVTEQETYVAGHERITNNAGSQNLTVPPTAKKALIVAEGGDVRYAPTGAADATSPGYIPAGAGVKIPPPAAVYGAVGSFANVIYLA